MKVKARAGPGGGGGDPSSTLDPGSPPRPDPARLLGPVSSGLTGPFMETSASLQTSKRTKNLPLIRIPRQPSAFSASSTANISSCTAFCRARADARRHIQVSGETCQSSAAAVCASEAVMVLKEGGAGGGGDGARCSSIWCALVTLVTTF